MPRHFLASCAAFMGLLVPGAFVLTLLAAPPARPQTVQPAGCDRNLADVGASLTAMQARLKHLAGASGPEMCTVTRLYFLELVKARAVTALCKSGADRERALGRYDADVQQINESIAARCS